MRPHLPLLVLTVLLLAAAVAGCDLFRAVQPSSAILVRVETSGGECPQGECGNRWEIRRDGVVISTGAVVPDTLSAFYASADIFVMPSLFEGYGMVLAEAMARGLAIVCTTGGAAAETVPDAAAVKVAPGDAAAFSAGLATVLTNRKLRRRLEAASWAAGRQLPTWNETARRIFIAITGLAAETIVGILPNVAAAGDADAEAEVVAAAPPPAAAPRPAIVPSATSKAKPKKQGKPE